jgi:hypothetical protein
MCLESSLGLLNEESFTFYLAHTTHENKSTAFFYALNDIRPLTNADLIRYYQFGLETLHLERNKDLEQLIAKARFAMDQ